MGAHGSRLPGATGPLQFLWWLPWLGLAIALWLGAWPTQQQRACWMGEWPFESGCPDVPLGSALDNPPDVYQRYLRPKADDAATRGVRELNERLATDERVSIAMLPFAEPFYASIVVGHSLL